MVNLVLTAIGDDRPGLVSALSKAVADHGGSWQTGEMARLGGKFAGIVLVSVPEERLHGLTDVLHALGDDGLEVSVTRTDPEPAEQPGERVHVHLVGNDRPGIVHQLSTVLATQRVSIEELATDSREAPMSGGHLFEANAVLRIPAGQDRDRLAAALEEIAGELMVDLVLSDDPAED